MTQTKIGVGMINATSIGDAKVLQGDGAWVTPSAGALTFISNTDISSAATYNFTAFTAGSYEHYVFYLQNLIPVTDAVFLWVRTSTDGGSSFDAGAADYDWCGAGATSYTTTQFVSRDHSDAQIALTGKLAGQPSVVVGSDTNENGASGVIQLFGPHTTSYTHVWTSLMVDNAYGESAGHFFVGKRLAASDVDGFQILFSSGNIESGTITAYGLANS